MLRASYILCIVMSLTGQAFLLRLCNHQCDRQFTEVEHHDINRTEFDVLRVKHITSKVECIIKCYDVEACLASAWKEGNDVCDKIFKSANYSSQEVKDSLVPADGWTIFIKEKYEEPQGTLFNFFLFIFFILIIVFVFSGFFSRC